MKFKQLLFKHGPISLLLSISAIAPSLAAPTVITELSAITLEGAEPATVLSQTENNTIESEPERTQDTPDPASSPDESSDNTETLSGNAGSLPLDSENTNCRNFAKPSIPVYRSTAIVVTPLTNISFSPNMNSQPVILQLAFPLRLAENCLLGGLSGRELPDEEASDGSASEASPSDAEPSGSITPQPTLLEASLTTTTDDEGFIIRMESFLINGHRFPLEASSRTIPFVRQQQTQGTNTPSTTTPSINSGLCELSGLLLPSLFLDDDDNNGLPFDFLALSRATTTACNAFTSRLSYTRTATLSAGGYYSLHLIEEKGTQFIPIPTELRAPSESTELLERIQNAQSEPQLEPQSTSHNTTILMESAVSARDSSPSSLETGYTNYYD